MTKSILEPNHHVATFAAGCFWSVQLHFQRRSGVLDTTVGYINGRVAHPTYRQVCSGETGHAEAVQVVFDDSIVSFEELVDLFWSIHDPTTLNRQKNDVGTQYRSGIYVHNDNQRHAAVVSKARHRECLGGKEIATEIEEAGEFYAAEEYHQRYLEKGGQCARVGSSDRVRCYG
ncbi:Aste57867_6087 [Aphanomyces stellatus]|uniref:peptide-methionine (S)-S-oxide reductase n=2 Tax=Aphanomyces stellatus TaxID=120398 RepID=A0A485KHQ6_9STRA|nr:hypothetical protein As57867_006073 [Aphanomyces stellatus]VFT83096.1 Aste57867_6087 [Aphanomyces stellatus]